jgi:hypothetical protein|nr:MAG TPA: hypothetical protein [Caudoviricetes sp.]
MNTMHIYELVTVCERAGAAIGEWRKAATFDRAEALDWVRRLPAPSKQGPDVYRDEVRDWMEFEDLSEYADGMSAAEALDAMNGEGWDPVAVE